MSVKQVFNTSAELDYPTVLPTLDLDFANSKTLDPRITFTRASGGSYYGADGLIKYAGVNEPRFDHDLSTGESLGFLVEESRTNLITLSTPGSGFFTGGGATVNYNDDISPNGLMEACRITRTNTGMQASTRNINFSSNTMCLSCWAKAQGLNDYFIWSFQNMGGAIVRAGFYLKGDGETTIITNGNGGHTLQIEKYPNGWYRCIIIGNTQSSGSTTQFLYSADNYSEGNLTTGGSTLVWGFQLEAGSFPTSYIPTEASTRTRAADTASITGKNFRDFFNTSQGTFFVEYKTTSPYNQRILAFGTSGFTTIISNEGVIGSGTFYSSIGNISGSAIDGVKVAATTSVSESAGSFDGNAAVSTGACSYYAGASSLNIISLDVGAGAPVGQNSIKRITYYPKRLTNQQLQALTT